jgi:H+/Cl- antiporter ClcA
VSRLSAVGTSALGALLGALAGAPVVIGVTLGIKALLGVVSLQPAWALILVPLAGLALSVLVLHGLGLSGSEPSPPKCWARAWRTFRPGVDRADLTADMVDFAGEEERFPWRLAPIHALAIVATVGLGGPLGTEKPAAYLGEAIGVALGDRGRWWRRLLRPAAVGGAAAGVSALMGMPLVGPAYVLELGHHHGAPLSDERLTAGLVGGVVGWLMNVLLRVDLFRLVVPKEPPHSFPQAAMAVVLIGSLAGAVTALTGEAIYRAKKWQAKPIVRLALGGLVVGADAVILATLAAPSAAVGPGGGAIAWVENNPHAAPLIVLGVALLRAVATTAAVAAGGCGGVFVPFLAVGDLTGRVFAPGLGVPGDLAGAAGAACGIAGGYGLPFTAVVVVLSQGGPHLATLTCLAAVAVAAFAGLGVVTALERVLHAGRPYFEKRAYEP